MYLFGSIITLITGLFYSLRYSLVKDLRDFKISKLQINFYYRLFSLPVLVVLAFILRNQLFSILPDFLLWLIIATVVNVFWGLYQVYIYQKSSFSSTESLQFLNIVFSTLAGVIIFGEIISFSKIAGISLTVIAFLILLFKDIKDKKQNFLKFQIVIYYLLTTLVDIVNKKAISLSSPIIYSISATVLLALAYLIFAKAKGQKIDRLDNGKMRNLLLLSGFLSGITVLGISYAYKLLPLGVAITLLSSRVFFSMWLSKAKYKEANILPNIIASIIALIGIGVMFI